MTTWAEHVMRYNECETTWRKSAAERERDWADGRCGWCGLLYDEHAAATLMVAALLTPDDERLPA